MDTRNQDQTEPAAPAVAPVDPQADTSEDDADLARLSDEIEALVDDDPASAAAKAVDVADRLGRQLEEDER